MKLNFQGRIIDLTEEKKDKYGIDKLMHISASLIEEWQKLSKRLDDGKLSVWEIGATAWGLNDELRFILENLNGLKREILDLDEHEMAELATFLMGAFSISRLEAYDAINNIVIKTISIIYDAASIVGSIKKLRK